MSELTKEIKKVYQQLLIDFLVSLGHRISLKVDSLVIEIERQEDAKQLNRVRTKRRDDGLRKVDK